MSMDWKGNIRKLQIDLSSYCNARCGACVRNITGGKTDPSLALEHFDVDVWNRLMRDDTRGIAIEKLTLNGNWGDPCMHPELPKMIDTFTRAHPEAFIIIATNGSMHSPEWWEELASTLSWGQHQLVQFAIDGLTDTHSIYRRKTVYDKIIANAQAFHAAGGRAEWILTLFDHNYHQKDEIIAEAERLGFDSIKIRRSHAEHMIIRDGTEQYDITTREIPDDEPNYEFYEFDENQEIYESKLRDKHIIRIEETDTDDTHCPWYNQGEVQIDPWGNVWPCCHISLYGEGPKLHNIIDKRFNTEEWLNKPYGRFNNLKASPLLEILEHQFYELDIYRATEAGDWKICQDMCDTPCGKNR